MNLSIKPINISLGVKTIGLTVSIQKIEIDWTYVFSYLLQEDGSFILQEDGSKLAQG
jgi:hypothetical protein